jgi:hypothetical protein
MIEVFVAITDDGTHRYYLLKVQRRGFDVYCFLPDSGVHYSLHCSGESHFRDEAKVARRGEGPPVALSMGEAGPPIKNGIRTASLRALGRAAGICTAHYAIDSLGDDFQEFNRRARECFVIDRNLFSKDVRGVEVGVWAVPAKNNVSFEFNNPNIPTELLYQVAHCEPQIWIYARPSVLFA